MAAMLLLQISLPETNIAHENPRVCQAIPSKIGGISHGYVSLPEGFSIYTPWN